MTISDLFTPGIVTSIRCVHHRHCSQRCPRCHAFVAVKCRSCLRRQVLSVHCPSLSSPALPPSARPAVIHPSSPSPVHGPPTPPPPETRQYVRYPRRRRRPPRRADALHLKLRVKYSLSSRLCPTYCAILKACAPRMVAK